MTYPLFLAAAVFEILGCWLAMAALRGPTHWLWLPALLALGAFAALLALTGSGSAGRTFAVYGGIYIAAAVAFMVLIERVTPDRWDLIGVGLCLAGAAVIFFGPRG